MFHHRGADTGTVMDSTGGKLSEQNSQNLTGLLAAVKQAGFAEITLVLNPMAPNAPSGWGDWQPDAASIRHKPSRQKLALLLPAMGTIILMARVDT